MIQQGYRERQDAQVALQAKQQIEYNALKEREREMAGKGRPPAHDKKAVDLLEALTFIGVASTKDDAPYKSHVMFVNGWAIMSDGQVSAGFPLPNIAELNCCPQLRQLKLALAKCGKTLAITHLPSGSLSVKGESLRAVVQCLPGDQMPEMEWDDPIAPCNDTLKEAFAACGVLTDENATDVIEASICMEAWICSATDRKSAIQYRHDNNLPRVTLPKLFTNAVSKIKMPITGFGWTENRSITLHFENGAWIKTLVYIDPWPLDAINSILSAQTSLVEAPKELFEGIQVVSEYNNHEVVLLKDKVIQSHLSSDIGAQYEVAFNGMDKQINAWHFKVLGPYMKFIDCTTDRSRVFFSNDKARGTVTCFVNSLEG